MFFASVIFDKLKDQSGNDVNSDDWLKIAKKSSHTAQLILEVSKDQSGNFDINHHQLNASKK